MKTVPVGQVVVAPSCRNMRYDSRQETCLMLMWALAVMHLQMDKPRSLDAIYELIVRRVRQGRGGDQCE